MEPIKKLIQAIPEHNQEVLSGGGKTAVGIYGTVTAATVHTWIGILVGILTCIFMALQIEYIWYKRKISREKERRELERNSGD